MLMAVRVKKTKTTKKILPYPEEITFEIFWGTLPRQGD